MQPRALTNDLSVSPQIVPDDVPTLAAIGFRSLICNRPDGEGPDQPGFQEIERKASALGLQVHYLPVHLQPYYRKRYGDLELPGARAYYQRCLSLPLYADMEIEEVDAVVEALKTVLGG